MSKLVRGYLKTAVQEGTGRKSQVPGYLTGGKTGTAEKIDPRDGTRWKGHYVVSFIGAAPIDDPKVVLYVVVDEPNVAEQADSTYPQVLFRQIATELFPYMGIYPTEAITDDLLQYLGISRNETVQNTVKSASFQCFDSSGNLYNDAAINKKETAKAAAKSTPRGSFESYARQWLGAKYGYAMATKTKTDCSGYVMQVYKGYYGISLDHSASKMYKDSRGKSVSRGSLKEGDLVFFGSLWKIDHVGMYLSGDRFIHASTSKGVMISPMHDKYWSPKYQGARRFR